MTTGSFAGFKLLHQLINFYSADSVAIAIASTPASAAVPSRSNPTLFIKCRRREHIREVCKVKIRAPDCLTCMPRAMQDTPKGRLAWWYREYSCQKWGRV